MSSLAAAPQGAAPSSSHATGSPLRKQSSVAALSSRTDSMANILSKSVDKQRVLHPNAAMIVRAIARDDVCAFVRELLLTAPTAEQRARTHCPPGSGYIADPTMDEENAVTKYVLKPDSGCDAAHVAAANDAFSILNYILRMENADLRNSRTFDTQWTPLHFAAFNQSERIAALLRSSGADLLCEDVYGDRPCDVAAALGNRMLAERLGDTSAASDDDEKKQRAYQQLLAQARAFEEMRAREEEDRQRQEQARLRIQQQQAEAAAQRRKLKAQYEAQRIMFIRERWLSARQSFVRDFVADQWNMFADWLTIVARTSAERAAAAATERQEREEASQRMLDASRRRKSKGGKKGKGAAKSRGGSTGASLTSPGGGVATTDDPLAAFLSTLEEEALPEANDRMTKEQKAEMAKVRAKLLKERKARREVEIARFKELQLSQLREQDELEELCLNERIDVENMWYCGIGNLTSYDPCADRKHSGFFRYEPFDNRFRWSCCGQRHDPFALGCLPAEDRSRAYVHTGCFRFHILGCACGGACLASVGGGASAANAVHLPPSTGSGHRLSGFVDTGLANRQARNQRRLGPQVAAFCNPGGCCWSCCGATTRGASGCTPQYRFLYAKHLLCDVRFSPADPKATVTTLVHAPSEDRGSSPFSSSDLRPSSPQEARSALLEETSQALVMSLLVPSDPEHTTDFSFIVGENGVSLQSDADREGVSYTDMLDTLRRKYTHALRTPEPPYCTMLNGLIRISANGRCIEHMTPPLTSKKTLRRTAPTASQPLAARATRINLLGNIVMRGDFLADVRRPAEGDANETLQTAHDEDETGLLDGDGPLPLDALGTLTSSSSCGFGGAPDIDRPDVNDSYEPPSSYGSAQFSAAMSHGAMRDATPYVRALPAAFCSQGLAHEHAGGHASYAFEVRLTCCPVPASVTDERLVIGLVQAQLPPSEDMADGGDCLDEALSDEEAGCEDDVAGRPDADSPAELCDESSVDFTAMSGGGDSPRRPLSPSPRVPQRNRQRNATMWSTSEENDGDDGQAEALKAARDAHRRKTLASSTRRRTGSIVSFPHEGAGGGGGSPENTDAPDERDDAASLLGSGHSALPTVGGSFCYPVSPNDIFRVSRRTRAYAARAGRYITGPHGIGWWSFTSSLRGMGQEHDMGAILEEGDLVTFVVDGMNASLHIFHNRSHTFSMRLPDTTTTGYVPAMTLVAGCRVDVEYVKSRLPYIDKWWREKALSERMLRMTTAAHMLDARLAAVDDAKRQASSRGGPLRRVMSHASSLRNMTRSASMDMTRTPIDEASEIRY